MAMGTLKPGTCRRVEQGDKAHKAVLTIWDVIFSDPRGRRSCGDDRVHPLCGSHVGGRAAAWVRLGERSGREETGDVWEAEEREKEAGLEDDLTTRLTVRSGALGRNTFGRKSQFRLGWAGLEAPGKHPHGDLELVVGSLAAQRTRPAPHTQT